MATTEPLRSANDIALVRAVLTTTRDRCLFALGINTAFRGGDLLALNMSDVADLQSGNDIVIREGKTKKVRRSTANAAVVDAVQALVRERYLNGAGRCDPLFVGNRQTRLTIVSLSRMWKDWCRKAGLVGNHASHSGRKTKPYLMRVEHNMPIEVICKALNHSSPSVTMRYLGIQDHEVKPFYALEL